MVAIVGDGLAPPDRDDGCAEIGDLPAPVVEVILARHRLPTGLEDSAQQIADERAASVADRQRPGRIGRHELDVDGARVDRRDTAPPVGIGQDPGDRRLEDLVGQAQVQEARGGDVDAGDGRAGRPVGGVGGDFVRDDPGDVQRRPAERPGQLQRQVRGQVTVLGLGGPLDLDRRDRSIRCVGKSTARDRAPPCGCDGVADLGPDRKRRIGAGHERLRISG